VNTNDLETAAKGSRSRVVWPLSLGAGIRTARHGYLTVRHRSKITNKLILLQ
jgi:hypothetical protein